MSLKEDSLCDLERPLTPGRNIEFIPTKPLPASWDSWHPFWYVMKDPSIGVISEEACIFQRPPTPGNNLELFLYGSSKSLHDSQVKLKDENQNNWDSKNLKEIEGTDTKDLVSQSLSTISNNLIQNSKYNQNHTTNNSNVPTTDFIHWLPYEMEL